MGANVIRDGSLTPVWRENTLRSFQAAAASGAAFVEFDVQVTKDGVPVVWHDNTVEYGDPAQPTQCAIADLTAAEFQALGELSASGKCQQLSVVRRFRHAAGKAAADMPSSLQAALTTDAAITQRMRWCCEADDSFPTLEQLFKTLPTHLAFNIEVKMATSDDLAVTPAEEINRMVQPILAVVNKYSSSSGSSYGEAGPRRQVVFSSFDPDVCRALRAAQDQHPVMFLSTGGRDWHADPRRMSIEAALDEAMSSRLSGVVVDSAALMANPEAASAARARGLRLLTYGLENDNMDWVIRQQQLGVTGVIVDDLQGLVGMLSGTQQGVGGVAAGLFGQVAAAAATKAVSSQPSLPMPGGPVVSAIVARS
jgi:glycerophosphodiester phosphodiesterase